MLICMSLWFVLEKYHTNCVIFKWFIPNLVPRIDIRDSEIPVLSAKVYQLQYVRQSFIQHPLTSFSHIYDMNFMLSGCNYNTVFRISKLERYHSQKPEIKIANSSQILLGLYIKCTLFDNITAATFSLFWSEWSYKRNTRMRWCRRHSRCRYQLQRSFDPHNQQHIPAASVIKSLSKLCPDSLFSYIFKSSWWWWWRCYKDCTLSPQITDEI